MNRIDKLVKLIDTNTEEIQLITGLNMNYYPFSLKQMERIIADGYTRENMQDNTLSLFGVYLGETIRRNIPNATWIEQGDYMDETCIEIAIGEGKIQINPFVRIIRYLEDRDYGLYAFYSLANDLGTGKVSLEEASKPNSPISNGIYSYYRIPVPKDIMERYQNGEITKEEMKRLAEERKE